MINQSPLMDVECNLCGTNKFRLKYNRVEMSKNLDLTEMFGAANSVYSVDQIVQCKTCGLVYTNPRIAPDILTKAYADGEYRAYLSETKAKTITLLENLEWVEGVFGLDDPLHGRRLLDVGTASGLFLQIAQQNGWEVVGIEPNHWLAEYGKNKLHLKIYNDTLDNIVLPANYFHAITLLDVIEHFDDPMFALKKLHNSLAVNGYVFIVTPNFDCIFSRILGRRWWFIMAHHLYYFTPKSISMMLDRAGFEVVKVQRHYGTWNSQYIVNMINSLNKSTPNDLIVKGLSLLARSLRIKRVSLYAGQMKVIARKKSNK